MNITYIIVGLAMICVGVLTVIMQIKWFKKGLKDQSGYQGQLMIAGFGLILVGVIMVVKSL